MAERHEYVVIGAGVLGLSVARELANRGRDVICLEQLTPGHDRAGSKSRTRILRAGYHDPFYVRLAMHMMPRWTQLEEESGRQLLVPSGLLSFGDDVEDLLASMNQGGAAGEIMMGEELGECFPGLAIPGRAVYERAAGILLADDALRALEESGAFEVRQRHAVTRISEAEDGVTIEAVEYSERPELRRESSGGSESDATRYEASKPPTGELETTHTFECRAAVLCGGAWSSHLARMAGLAELADELWASLQQVIYVTVPEGREERFPAVVWYRSAGVAYGLPTPGEGTYKLGLHDPRPEVDPDRVSLRDDPSDLALLAEVTARLLPEAVLEPVASERCFYDNTADEGFVLDRLGRLVIGAGTSGHGFKFGPLIGEVLADLAEEKPPSIPIERFSARRAFRLP